MTAKQDALSKNKIMMTVLTLNSNIKTRKFKDLSINDQMLLISPKKLKKVKILSKNQLVKKKLPWSQVFAKTISLPKTKPNLSISKHSSDLMSSPKRNLLTEKTI